MKESGIISSFNPAAADIFGYRPDEVTGENFSMLISASDHIAHKDYLSNYLLTGKNSRENRDREVTGRRKNGVLFPMKLSVAHMEIEGQIQFIASISDLTEQKRAQENIQHMAHHDALTGLSNRVLFQDRLDNALGQAQRNGQLGSVMFLDLDRFKTINDGLGHHVGDALLQAVAKRLEEVTRTSDTVSRLGGDEFAIIQTELNHVDGAIVLAEKIIDALSKPFDIEGEHIYTSTSIGIALYPLDDITTAQLLKRADMAMYATKNHGRNGYTFFEASMESSADGRRSMEAELRVAIEQQDMELYYQPQIDVVNMEIAGFEALVRWNHVSKGMIPPLDFIPLSEETGLIMPLGDWILREACRQLNEWILDGLPALRIAVNLSAKQFESQTLVPLVESLLAEYQFEPHLLELEITESMLMANAAQSAEQLRALHELGVELSIDDFGTGYSSLAYLKTFPVHTLKVDQSFVRDIGSDTDDEAIVQAVVGLGHSLGLKVVGEGVETASQLSYLSNLACDFVQGYYFSPPMPAGKIPEYIHGFSKKSQVIAAAR